MWNRFRISTKVDGFSFASAGAVFAPQHTSTTTARYTDYRFN